MLHVLKSTCCFESRLPTFLKLMLPADCRMDVRDLETSGEISRLVVRHLHRRCLRWNGPA